ncbi:calcium-binding protein [Roseivivax sp.]
MQADFNHEGSVFATAAGQIEGLRALALHEGPEGVTLQVIAGEDAALRLSTWDAPGGAPRAESEMFLPGGAVAGVTPEITQAVLPSGQAVALLTGAAPAGLVMLRVNDDGSFGGQIGVDTYGAGVPRDLSDIALHSVDGRLFLYGIAPGSTTPMVWELSGSGQLSLVSSGSRAADAPGLTDLAVINGQLVAVGAGEDFLQLYEIRPNGTLSLEAALGDAANPGISGDVTVEVVSVGGTPHAVLGAAGTGSLSVFALTPAGPVLTDHLMDNRHSRFAAVTQMDSLVLDGRAYLAAGGGDDGVSLFELSETGTLLHLGALEDTPTTALTALSGLILYDAGGGQIGLATLGEGDQGMSLFSVGLSGARVQDGPGSDTLTASAAADLFTLTADAESDVIQGFDPAQDRLDLSGWAFYRDPSQLTVNASATGAEIRFMSLVGEEVLRIESASGAPLSPEEVVASILPAPDRFLPDWLTPDWQPAPSDPDRALTGSPGWDTLEAGSGDDTVTGRGGSDLISAGAGNDTVNAGIGADTIFGGAGDDSLAGLDGADSLSGDDGADWLAGNAGQDVISGDGGADSLMGGQAPDALSGGAGADTLAGEDGADTLDGGEGADLLTGNAGPDALMGGAAEDLLYGGINHDHLSGGTEDDALYGEGGNDTLAGDEGADTLFGGGSNDRLEGGAGDDSLDGGLAHDALSGGAGDDWMVGKNGADTLTGGSGDDTLYGGSGNDVLQGGAGTDWLDGGAGADVFVFAEGSARIAEFQNDVDTLVLDAALWGGAPLEPEEVLGYATPLGEDLVFSFPEGERLVIAGMSNPAALLNDLEIL